MKVLYGEGIANHTGPEPCAGTREGAGETSVGERAGRVLSPENIDIPGADLVRRQGRQHGLSRHRKWRSVPAWSETPDMYGSTPYGARESSTTDLGRLSQVRAGEAGGRSQ